MKTFSTLLIALLALLLLSPVALGSNSGLNEYQENVPTAKGDVPTNGSKKDPGKKEPEQAPAPELELVEPAPASAASVPEEFKGDRKKKQKKRNGGKNRREQPGPTDPIVESPQVVQLTADANPASGIGLGLPLAMVALLVGAVSVGVKRRRAEMRRLQGGGVER